MQAAIVVEGGPTWARDRPTARRSYGQDWDERSSRSRTATVAIWATSGVPGCSCGNPVATADVAAADTAAAMSCARRLCFGCVCLEFPR